MAAVSVRKYSKAEGKDKKNPADRQVVEITVWKNYCVLAGEQAKQSEEEKAEW